MSQSPVYDPEATCVSCGCTDSRACTPKPCSWVAVDYDAGLGVCSNKKCNTKANLKKLALDINNYNKRKNQN